MSSTTLTRRNEGATTLPGLMSDFFNVDPFFKPGWLDRELSRNMPAVNIKETEKEFRIEVVAPGFKKEEFSIDLEGDVLTLSAERKSETKEEDPDARYTRREYNYSSFVRSFSLPENSQPEKIKAHYEDGVLHLDLPKKSNGGHKGKKKVSIT